MHAPIPTISLSLPQGFVALCGAKHIGVLGLEETLFLNFVVVHFSALLPWNSSQVRLLPWVSGVVLHNDALSQEVKFYLLHSLAIVQTNLNSTSSFACAQHVVLIDHSTNYVFAA